MTTAPRRAVARQFVRADLHTHAIGDGRFDTHADDLVRRHLYAAVAAGLTVIGVTDHDELRTGLMAAERASIDLLPILVLPGMEVTTEEGHLVVLGLEEPLRPWRSMTETVMSAREYGALVILPHPFFPALRARNDVDAIERHNQRYGDFDVDRTDVAVIASSDAHTPDDLLLNPRHTVLSVDDVSIESVFLAIRERRVHIAMQRTNGRGESSVTK